MLRAEFLRFLQTLNTVGIPNEVRKIANLVLANLDAIEPLGTNQGQRVKRVVALAQTNWDSLSSEIQPLPEQNTELVSSISRLKSLSVGPFRGFSRQEDFDLDARLVLIYGPNGTGKSSFCEALEYKLLGSVAEAESKRFRNQNEYFKNAHVNDFTMPEVIGVGDQGQEVSIESNEALYRFCFVEKNRIDNFSRIAALAPSRQTELISTLFGLDLFNDFVRNFTAEIDSKYIDLTGIKAAQLKDKRLTLSGANQQLEANNAELQKLVSEEQTLATQYREGITFQQMIIEIKGDEQNNGIIQKLEAELQTPIGNKSSLTYIALQEVSGLIISNLTELNTKQQQLAAVSQQVSFKNLYNAIVQLQPDSPEHCPACHTQLTQTQINPYTHANEELVKLEFLATLQESMSQLEQKIIQLMQTVSQIISTCCHCLPQRNILESYLTPSGGTLWNALQQQLQDGSTPWQHLESQVKLLEESDKKIDETAQIREAKQIALGKLRELDRKIIVLQTRRNTAQQVIESAQQLINSFYTKNMQLIADVALEDAIVRKNCLISGSYSRFVATLNAYKERLPQQLVANLGDNVVTLYNAFNRNDLPREKLSTIKLPLIQNQRLEVSFQNNPEQYFDALHVLSEGHVRCIGLAILLAKNINERCPLLIFDDPVNAIDDDHRESIRRTLFEDVFFAEKQIILACHGEEFFKDIHNLLPAQVAAQSRSFSFLPRLDESHIRVDFNCSPRNYIIAARGHFERNEIREALAKSRQSLESLMKTKVWRYVNRYGDGNLSLKLRSYTSPIELRNLSEQIKKQINKADFSDPNKNEVFSPIDALLGLNGDSREWRYLNKGTHEENDRAEFDRATVSTMISALENLDQAIAG
ncbi:AAA family ATPase [Buttiauxella selenatireducens]|uniref:AAA family ATPase n=1 Tax=Buttiauxella selenatireducens TaxID=3073902 RepID=A0ABY9S755_9ENTR|nr:AAA family ATPase [Buttiauxella sp. R73]WMY73330.1 AAA family ATPase [Buttiauxella sp. R73]